MNYTLFEKPAAVHGMHTCETKSGVAIAVITLDHDALNFDDVFNGAISHRFPVYRH